MSALNDVFLEDDILESVFTAMGDSYVPSLDRDRLLSQQRVFTAVMLDGRQHEVEELRSIAEKALNREVTGQSATARIRALRWPKFGAFNIIRRRIGPKKGGHFTYRLLTCMVVLDSDGRVKSVRGSNGTRIPFTIIKGS